MSSSGGLLLPSPTITEAFSETDYFSVEEYENLVTAIVDTKKLDSGILDAARLVLSESAVVIQFIDTSELAEWVPRGYPPSFKAKGQIGFNDHGGGSESHFRILLNRHVEGGPVEQYVLYSPPDEYSRPSSKTFHRASFTFPADEPAGLEYETYLPNILKTHAAASRQGRHFHDFFLFGDSSTPILFSQIFERIGFSFNEQPYTHEEMNKLKHISRQNRHLQIKWPGSQFSAEVARI
jgi:hypothetical protein